MVSSYSTDLKLELMVTGENAGTWGTKTNTNLNLLQQAIAGFQSISIAGGAQTTALTMDNAAISNARNAVIKLTGTITGNQIVTVPNGIEKTYIIENNTTGAFTVQFKTASGTGPTWSTTDKGIKILFADGTNVVDVNANLSASTFASISSGQIDILAQAELRLQDTAGGQYVGFKAPGTVSSSYTLTLPSADGSNGQALVTNGSGVLSFTTAGRTGTVNWDTTPKTTTVTAVSGNGYFVNTTSGAVTVNLPAGSAGSIVAISDYANTAATNNITIVPNSTDKINGVNASSKIATNGAAITLVYVDSTRGWKDVNDATLDVTGLPPFVAATGGTVLTCGDFKTHVFTGPGTFTVTTAGTPAGSNSVEYLVVAGGGGGGVGYYGGGGGAGGYRQNYPSPTTAGLPVSVTSYPIVVGGGGSSAGAPALGQAANARGVDSSFSTITSTGGGGGGNRCAGCGQPGGSGGGKSDNFPGSTGTGNTPPVSPSQGNPGGPSYFGAGGGGASAAGISGATAPPYGGGTGGAGSPIATTLFGPTAPSYGTPGPAPGRYFAGGGGGGRETTGQPGAGGSGGGGTGGVYSPNTAAVAGTTNTGGGGGGGGGCSGASFVGANGGSGIVAIRYKFQ